MALLQLCTKCHSYYHGRDDVHLCYMPVDTPYIIDELGVPQIIGGETRSKESHDLFVASQAELYGWEE